MQITVDQNRPWQTLSIDLRISAAGQPQQDLLIAMYDRFDPLGGALGLPPRREDERHRWIQSALGYGVNVAAFSQAWGAVGHCFLADDKSGSAEMAVFVHQAFRRRGIGTALVKAALEWGYAAGVRRVWTIASSDNIAALCLQKSCGFRLTSSGPDDIEMEIELSPASPKDMLQIASVEGDLERVAPAQMACQTRIRSIELLTD
jgi:GNAT superfamily N-acetyltransferase